MLIVLVLTVYKALLGPSISSYRLSRRVRVLSRLEKRISYYSSYIPLARFVAINRVDNLRRFVVTISTLSTISSIVLSALLVLLRDLLTPTPVYEDSSSLDLTSASLLDKVTTRSLALLQI